MIFKQTSTLRPGAPALADAAPEPRALGFGATLAMATAAGLAVAVWAVATGAAAARVSAVRRVAPMRAPRAVRFMEGLPWR